MVVTSRSPEQPGECRSTTAGGQKAVLKQWIKGEQTKQGSQPVPKQPAASLSLHKYGACVPISPRPHPIHIVGFTADLIPRPKQYTLAKRTSKNRLYQLKMEAAFVKLP